MKISIAQQIEEVVREIALRNKVYPRMVATSKMRQSVADYHIERIAAVRQTLEWLQENEEKIKAALAPKSEAA